ncbi:sigma-70 family RNA polymerase sigma factor [Peribacillus alkalitolerans]|uniref:sigma-70 family RNA polymerase sigma factor n=1 Tax=Peribacillus alkalitolerans TaxID=1550385 RepID=UPI0013D24D53|nr:sigma-70 family RNA polymerase sigma factor [Peribacillus alkalitolerans]
MDTFETLVESCSPLINSIIHSIGIYKNKEEYFQIGLIALWEAYEKYDSRKGSFTTFAYSVIHGRILNHLRKEYRYDSCNISADPQVQDYYTQLSYFPEYLQEEIIWQYCAGLTDKQKQWIKGSILEGKGIKEIALEHNVSIETVKSWRKLALTNLRLVVNSI